MTSSSDATLDAGPGAPSRFDRFGAAGGLLTRIARGGRIAPAYLFEGPDLASPREAARLFAAALLCTAADAPCGTCSTCHRVASGQHPDLHVQGRDKATVISVEALAALLERAHASPAEGQRQVFVVEPADALAPEAVARYLKTLEEPPASTTFCLVTARPDRLPETVRSRCQRLHFAGPSEADIARRLLREGADPERAAVLARWASGSPARGKRLLGLAMDEVLDALSNAGTGRPCAAATTAETLLGDLRTRMAALGASAVPEEAAPEAAGTPPSEALRNALDDLFHAASVAARDRAAGREGGPFAPWSPATAAAFLARFARLAGHVRRNVSPAALLIETVSALRRP